VWAYTGTAPIFWVPPIISGTDKATNLKFGTYIHRVHPNQSPLKFWEKMERGRIQGLPQLFEYPILSQERVKLRTSNLAGIFTVGTWESAVCVRIEYRIESGVTIRIRIESRIESAIKLSPSWATFSAIIVAFLWPKSWLYTPKRAPIVVYFTLYRPCWKRKYGTATMSPKTATSSV